MSIKTVAGILKPQFKLIAEQNKDIRLKTYPSVDHDVENLEFILNCMKTKVITFSKKNKTNDVKEVPNQRKDADERSSSGGKAAVPKKKRGRPANVVSSDRDESPVNSESSEKSLNDSNTSIVSTASSRSRRAAAQAAGQKMTQVQSFMNAKKLRRPTDFDEKKSKALDASLPPSKSRKTYRKQSAGSSSAEEKEKENQPTLLVEEENLKNCLVSVENLNSPRIRALCGQKTSCKRKSEDLFTEESIPLSERGNPTVLAKTTKRTNRESQSKRVRGKKGLDKGESSSEETDRLNGSLSTGPDDIEVGFKGFQSVPCESKNVHTSPNFAHSSPITANNSESKKNDSLRHKSLALKVEETVEKNTRVTRRTVAVGNESDNGDKLLEVEESASVKSRTKVLKKANKIDNTIVIEENIEVVESTSRRTRGNKKASKISKVKEEVKTDESEDNQKSPVGKRRTKTLRSRTRSQSSQESPENLEHGRTKTLRKGGGDGLPEIMSMCLASEFKEPTATKIMRVDSPRSPRGEMVKKRVEDFEKMKALKKASGEENSASGRVTRNAAKAKASAESKEKRKLAANAVKNAKRLSLAKELRKNIDKENIPQSSKTTVSASKVYPVVEKGRMTPLGTQNRVTPGLKLHSTTKHLNGPPRQNPEENVRTVIQKQTADELEKKLREEKKLRQQAKEEEAQKKKEKVLKAHVEEAKRKREEKHQKVAAAKEAADREKALLTAMKDKDKEDRLKLAMAEKEKRREEMQKKKLLAQQKAQEHEERRRQEEAARLAKLKEQEEEHKRAMAMKEREQELIEKQHRLNEANKTMKVAPNIAKVKTDLKSPVNPQPSSSYEITPAREDRPPMKPKTENDYGIDDAQSEDSSDDESQPKKQIPLWAQSKYRQRLVATTCYVPEIAWNLFMECNPCMPDVTKIFEGIPVKRRIRTSSAVWNTPPLLSKNFQR